MRGYFGIGIYHTKNVANMGCLWRSAQALGAAFIFTVGKRYKHQPCDTTKALRHVPLYEYGDWEQFRKALPRESRIVAVETGGLIELPNFVHPPRAIYVLGAEDTGLPPDVIDSCHATVTIPSNYCLNVAVAGSIVLYDRAAKYARSAAIGKVAA